VVEYYLERVEQVQMWINLVVVVVQQIMLVQVLQLVEVAAVGELQEAQLLPAELVVQVVKQYHLMVIQ
jgi:hypothetical protein